MMDELIKYNIVLRQKFINSSLVVISNWTQEVTGIAPVFGVSDELSVAIVAFNSAIDKFAGKDNFYNFARQQVKNAVLKHCGRTRSKSIAKKLCKSEK